MIRKKDINEKIEIASQKQYVADKKIHQSTMNKVWALHNREIEKIHKGYRKDIEELQKQQYEELKKAKKERIDVYEILLDEKIDHINELNDKARALRDKLKEYEAAYDIYREFRNHLAQMSRKMKVSTDKVKANSIEIYQAFSEMEDLSEFHLRKMQGLEPKIEAKMFGVDNRVELNLLSGNILQPQPKQKSQ